jgi:hypothetical protein
MWARRGQVTRLVGSSAVRAAQCGSKTTQPGASDLGAVFVQCGGVSEQTMPWRCSMSEQGTTLAIAFMSIQVGRRRRRQALAGKLWPVRFKPNNRSIKPDLNLLVSFFNHNDRLLFLRDQISVKPNKPNRNCGLN